MYFNENKEDTNIDKEFNKKKEFNLANYKIPLIIVGGIILLVIIIAIVISLTKGSNKYYLALKGDPEITIYQGATYYELGFDAHDGRGKDLTSEVMVKDNTDTSTTGTYIIIYTLYNKNVKRTVKVVERPENITIIHLYGSKEMTIGVGEEFNDPGCEVIDAIDYGLTEQVVKTGTVDTSKKGKYEIIYSVTNSMGVTTAETRTVIVE